MGILIINFSPKLVQNILVGEAYNIFLYLKGIGKFQITIIFLAGI